jgi:hypothetical protein
VTSISPLKMRLRSSVSLPVKPGSWVRVGCDGGRVCTSARNASPPRRVKPRILPCAHRGVECG